MSSSSSSPAEEGGLGVLRASQVRILYRENGRQASGLDGFSADFRPGITGLIGPNGAGKTTFLRAVAGLLHLTSGSLEMDGKSPGELVASQKIGFLPENPILPGHLTVEEFLTGIQQAGGGRTPEASEAPGVAGSGSTPWGPGIPSLQRSPGKRLAALSLGQRKLVALSAALLGSPEILLLDEPTNGLDPPAVGRLREALRRERRRGILILVSSHHLDELQRIADALTFVKEGRVAGSWSRRIAGGGFVSLESLFHLFFGGA
jgi:ABC-2 type transport system ATP-binding protein